MFLNSTEGRHTGGSAHIQWVIEPSQPSSKSIRLPVIYVKSRHFQPRAKAEAATEHSAAAAHFRTIPHLARCSTMTHTHTCKTEPGRFKVGGHQALFMILLQIYHIYILYIYIYFFFYIFIYLSLFGLAHAHTNVSCKFIYVYACACANLQSCSTLMSVRTSPWSSCCGRLIQVHSRSEEDEHDAQ